MRLNLAAYSKRGRDSQGEPCRCKGVLKTSVLLSFVGCILLWSILHFPLGGRSDDGVIASVTSVAYDLGSPAFGVPSEAESLSLPETVRRAAAAVDALQKWYDIDSGLWQTTGWWNSANALTTLADFTLVYPEIKNVTIPIFENTFRQAQQWNGLVMKTMTPFSQTSHSSSVPRRLSSASRTEGFLNDYYDDEGWWALAWIRVYDITHQHCYLATAVSIFEDMTQGWTAPCGGLWWDKAHSYTGAIENSLFLSVAALLANRVSDSDKKYYLDWALKELDWFQKSGMINADYNINNGVNLQTCKNDNGTVWTYNQGVILGGLLELNKAHPDPEHILLAQKIAFAAVPKLFDTNKGILHESCEPDCGADGSQFKGILARNLQLLHQEFQSWLWEDVIRRNANSIWTFNRDDDNEMGLLWSGPFNKADASTQSSALDALVAAVALASIGNLVEGANPEPR